MHRRKVQAARQNLHQLFAVVCNAAAGSAQRKAGTNEHRKAELRCKLQAVAQIIYERGFRYIEADAQHGIFEEQPVLGLLDGFELGADQFDVIAVQNPRVGQIDSQVERRLPTDCRQQCKFAGSLAFDSWNGDARTAGKHLRLDADDLFDVLAGQRLDVCTVGQVRVGHDGSRVGVHQHHLVALLLESLAGLRAGVIKLRRLPNHNGPRADHQYLLYVISAWHVSVRFLDRVGASADAVAFGIVHSGETEVVPFQSLFRFGFIAAG